MARLPTIADVAERAGVSRQTVSNVLNSPDIVLGATRERVEGAIRELGFVRNDSARRLRTRASSAIGFRLDPERDGMSGVVHDRFLHALTEQLDSRGMRITLFTARDLDDEIAHYASLRDRAEVDGVIFTGTGYRDPRFTWLVDNGLPFVAFGRPWGADFDDPGLAWVDVDGRAGTAAATAHLRRRGLERIGFLGWPVDDLVGRERWEGWAADLRAAFGYDDATLDSLCFSSQESVRDARQAVEALLARHEGPGLDALVCASDSLALGAMMAVREAGQPHFPVIGFDNTAVSKAVGLSSVDQRLDEVAAAAIEILMGTAGQRVLPTQEATAQRHRLITPRLVVRRSSHLAPVDETLPEPGAGTREEP